MITQNRIDALEARTAKLERSARCWRAVSTALVGIVAAGVLIGWSGRQAGSEIVKAREFWVVNDKGVPVVQLNSNDDGHGNIAILNHRLAVALSADPKGGYVYVTDPTGGGGVRLGITPDGGGRIAIRNSKGAQTGLFECTGTGGMIELSNRHGAARARLYGDAEPGGGVQLFPSDGGVSTDLRFTADGAGVLLMPD